MVRRYVYDPVLDALVEIGRVRPAPDAAERYADDRREYNHQQNTEASPEAGRRLIDRTLERAERREWAHKRFGTERRWAE